jgi:hypothetical protein
MLWRSPSGSLDAHVEEDFEAAPLAEIHRGAHPLDARTGLGVDVIPLVLQSLSLGAAAVVAEARRATGGRCDEWRGARSSRRK